jgi:uncharacterized protein
MKLTHQFSVPTDVESAWNLLLDLPRVARCMPGASVDTFDGQAFAGSVKVKMGPMQVVYRGSGRFDSRSQDDRVAVLSGQAKESRGTGTAKATITVQLTGDGGLTKASVVTDLAITGRPAQLGRGLMDDVAGQLIAQFADELAREIRGDDPSEQRDPVRRDDVLDVGGIGATVLLGRAWPVAAVVVSAAAAGCMVWMSARRGARRCD